MHVEPSLRNRLARDVIAFFPLFAVHLFGAVRLRSLPRLTGCSIYESARYTQ